MLDRKSIYLWHWCLWKGESIEESILALKGKENSTKKESSCSAVAVVLWPSGAFVSGDGLGIHFDTPALVRVWCTGMSFSL